MKIYFLLTNVSLDKIQGSRNQMSDECMDDMANKSYRKLHKNCINFFDQSMAVDVMYTLSGPFRRENVGVANHKNII